jgi:hypothetical protein
MLSAKEPRPQSGTAPKLKKHLPYIRSQQRDVHILLRWYFYKTAFDNLPHRWIVQLLMNEFYLSSSVVKKVMDAQTESFNQMVKDKSRLHTLKEYAPHFSWNAEDFKGLPMKKHKR